MIFLREAIVCFRAEHVLVLICWQIVGKRKFLPTRMGQKFSEKLQKPMKKAKKFPHPQTKVQESLVAASRNRTGTGLTPGILSPLRLPVPPWRRVFIITEWARSVKPCPLQKNDFTRRRTNSAKCRSFSCAVLSQFLLNTDLSSAPS